MKPVALVEGHHSILKVKNDSVKQYERRVDSDSPRHGRKLDSDCSQEKCGDPECKGKGHLVLKHFSNVISHHKLRPAFLKPTKTSEKAKPFSLLFSVS